MSKIDNAKRVLIVEDNMMLSQLYKTKLLLSGFNASIAENGEIALSTVEKFNPDIILLDIMMPVMTGDEFLEKLRKKEKFADVPVIILTNMNNGAIAEKFEPLNISGFLIKSELTPSQVVDYARDILKSHKKRR